MENPVLIEVRLDGGDAITAYPDLPSFISDTSAYVQDDCEDSGFYWEGGDEPELLLSYIEASEDGVIYFDDLISDGELIYDAIQTTKTCVVCDIIHPEMIVKIIKQDELMGLCNNHQKSSLELSSPGL